MMTKCKIRYGVPAGGSNGTEGGSSGGLGRAKGGEERKAARYGG